MAEVGKGGRRGGAELARDKLRLRGPSEAPLAAGPPGSEAMAGPAGVGRGAADFTADTARRWVRTLAAVGRSGAPTQLRHEAAELLGRLEQRLLRLHAADPAAAMDCRLACADALAELGPPDHGKVLGSGAAVEAALFHESLLGFCRAGRSAHAGALQRLAAAEAARKRMGAARPHASPTRPSPELEAALHAAGPTARGRAAGGPLQRKGGPVELRVDEEAANPLERLCPRVRRGCAVMGDPQQGGAKQPKGAEQSKGAKQPKGAEPRVVPQGPPAPRRRARGRSTIARGGSAPPVEGRLEGEAACRQQVEDLCRAEADGRCSVAAQRSARLAELALQLRSGLLVRAEGSARRSVSSDYATSMVQESHLLQSALTARAEREAWRELAERFRTEELGLLRGQLRERELELSAARAEAAAAGPLRAALRERDAQLAAATADAAAARRQLSELEGDYQRSQAALRRPAAQRPEPAAEMRAEARSGAADGHAADGHSADGHAADGHAADRHAGYSDGGDAASRPDLGEPDLGQPGPAGGCSEGDGASAGGGGCEQEGCPGGGKAGFYGPCDSEREEAAGSPSGSGYRSGPDSAAPGDGQAEGGREQGEQLDGSSYGGLAEVSPSAEGPEHAEDLGEPEDPEDAADLEEAAGEYGPGGYHRVQQGGKLDGGRYTAIAELGSGGFSTVWLAADGEEDGNLVALKIAKAAHGATADAEIEMLEHSAAAGDFAPALRQYAAHVCTIARWFEETGPNGTHVVMALPLMGCDLHALSLGHECRGVSPSIVKVVALQLLRGLSYMHDAMGAAHTDLKPENILLAARSAEVLRKMQGTLPPERRPTEAEISGAEALLSGAYEPPAPGESLRDALLRQYDLKISDLGSARYLEDYYEPGTMNTTLHYRAPECLLGFQLVGTAVDVWALGCIIFEMLTGEYLFNPVERDVDKYAQDEFHMMLMVETLGPFPQSMVRGRAGVNVDDYFTDGRFMHNMAEGPSVAQLLRDSGCDESEAEAAGDFIMRTLAYDPARRARAGDLLGHPWLELPDGGPARSPEPVPGAAPAPSAAL